ncbi:iron chelate uptake ABC transporter family permease subunit [Oceanicola sp. 502str15]|uniref:iron chelate uptake ABC transporter family permease subunit n=1 Tax=Oceanicola sp. 502str15 TaxID=2696061 RepID=UPI0020950024|nr:iron chelate uptake ABC transporter family permease subunit [Oceanicola sp. 502str15]MCO6384669.1 iron chelate uptake ABC transporter family permease subunit [Oceanicola sp. 502str15]
MPDARRLLPLALALALFIALFLAWNLRAPVEFILTLRATKLASLLVVGAAIGAATVIFQTITENRLLTPGIVGFDALYIFIQTAIVLLFGGAAQAGTGQMVQFFAEAGCLVAASLALFALLLRRGASDILRMVLTGVILGIFLRGLTSFAQRLLDPSEFAIVQQASFASFTAVDPAVLAIASLTLAATLAGALWLAPSLDAAGLGRQTARGIGLDHDRVVLLGLALVALMVALSTALVGPVTFLGLIAASLAYRLTRSWRHITLIPAAALIGAAILVAGQFVFERLLGLQSTLAVVVEFLGGLLFLVLLLKRSAR